MPRRDPAQFAPPPSPPRNSAAAPPVPSAQCSFAARVAPCALRVAAKLAPEFLPPSGCESIRAAPSRQKWQSTAQPACVEMQIVCRPSLGMNTASTEAGSAAPLCSSALLRELCVLRVLCVNFLRSRPAQTNTAPTHPSTQIAASLPASVTRASFASRSRSAAGKIRNLPPHQIFSPSTAHDKSAPRETPAPPTPRRIRATLPSICPAVPFCSVCR